MKDWIIGAIIMLVVVGPMLGVALGVLQMLEGAGTSVCYDHHYNIGDCE